MELAHPLGTERDEFFPHCRRVCDERRDVDRLAGGCEWAEPFDPFFEKDGRTVKVSAAPVVEADPDLQDPVIQVTNRRGRVPPQELERLVLLEELSGVELLDAAQQGLGCGVGTAGAGGLDWCAGRLPFGRAPGLPRTATRLGRARVR